MFKSTFASLRGNIIRRTTNPFLGTLLFIWLIRNWEFVYSLFFFDEEYTLSEKISFIENYFSNYNLWDLALTIVIAFTTLIITYFLVNLSRLIVNLFEKKITPWIYKVTDKGSVVVKSDFLELQELYYETEQKFQNERKEKLILRQEIEQKDEKIKDLLTKDIKSQNSTETEGENKLIDKIYSQLSTEFEYDRIKQIFEDVANSDEIYKDDPLIRSLTTYDIIEHSSRSSEPQLAFYKFTERGKMLRDRFLLS